MRCPVSKRMIGDVVIVVIDEIGEVTFSRDPMFPLAINISRKETVERGYAAIIELVDLCSTFVPVSAAQFKLMQALELLLRDRAALQERLTDQIEFYESIDEAAGTGGTANANASHKFLK